MIITEEHKKYELFQRKETYPFNEVTLDGNNIKGEVILSHDNNHGSLLITECNNKKTLQYIQGFPRMNYYKKQILNSDEIKFYEKLDGTCVCVYKLYDEKGNLLEYVPKSRQKAVLDERLIEMYNLCDTKLIHTPSKNDLDCLYFEIYGMLNQHTVKHYKTYINLALIGAYDGEHFLSDDKIKEVSKNIQIEQPECIGAIYPCDNDKYQVKFFNTYYYDEIKELYNTKEQNILESLELIKKYLDKVNKLYTAEKDSLKYEGVVLRYNSRYIKLKPESYFELSGRNVLGVSVQEIKKEIHKLLDERIDLLMENYDEEAIKEEININLEEDYDSNDVHHPRVQRAITKQLHEFIEKIPDKNLNDSIEELMKKHPQATKSELMKLFASENPLLKHKSRLVYNIIDKKMSR